MVWSAVGLLAALVAVSACAAPPPVTGAPQSSPSGAPPGAAEPHVRFFRAWAGNDIAQMVLASSPRTPARSFARYWADLLRAGRVDTAAPEWAAGPDGARLTYPDGSSYRFRAIRVDGRGRVRDWRSVPGGRLGLRIVAGPPASAGVGSVRATALRQYRNAEGDLRVTLRLRSITGVWRIGARGYGPPSGAGEVAASLGSGGESGEITVRPRRPTVAVAAVQRSRVGGRLRLYGYRPGERGARTTQPAEATLVLPRPAQ